MEMQHWLGFDNKVGLIDEFLDYISGYIGNKKRWIRDKRLLLKLIIMSISIKCFN